MLKLTRYDRKQVEIDALKDELRDVKKRLAAAEDAIDGLQTAPKQLRLEWEDTLDRLNRIMGRLNARVKRDPVPEGGEPHVDDPAQQQIPFNPIEAHRRMRARKRGA